MGVLAVQLTLADLTVYKERMQPEKNFLFASWQPIYRATPERVEHEARRRTKTYGGTAEAAVNAEVDTAQFPPFVNQ